MITTSFVSFFPFPDVIETISRHSRLNLIKYLRNQSWEEKFSKLNKIRITQLWFYQRNKRHTNHNMTEENQHKN